MIFRVDPQLVRTGLEVMTRIHAELVRQCVPIERQRRRSSQGAATKPADTGSQAFVTR